MDRFVGKTLIARDRSGIGREAGAGMLSPLVNILIKCGLLAGGSRLSYRPRCDGHNILLFRISKMVGL